MQYRQDLWNELTEVLQADMVSKTPGARADKPEALKVAKHILRENEDGVAQELPSPLICQPADLHRYMLKQCRPQDLATSRTYPFTRGGAWTTRAGRIVIVEFKDILTEHSLLEAAKPTPAQRLRIWDKEMLNEAVSAITPDFKTTDMNRTETQPEIVRPRPNGMKKMMAAAAAIKNQQHPNAYGPDDEGSVAYVTVLARTPQVYHLEWNPDEELEQVGSHAAFHIVGEDDTMKWRPMTLQSYLRLAEMIKGVRGKQATQVQQRDAKLDAQPTQKMPVQQPVQKPVQPLKPGQEPVHQDVLGKRKKFLGVF